MNDVRIPWVGFASPAVDAFAQTVPWHLRLFNLRAIQDRVGGVGETIANLDTGITKNHPEFAGRIVKGRSFIPHDDDWGDRNFHGTATAGVAAGETYGVNPQASIMPVKVLDDGGSGANEWIATGIRYAVDNGATWISGAFGGRFASKELEKAVEYAKDYNVPCVFASGNEGRRRSVSYPAFYAVAPGAMDEQFNVARFSNGGEGIDLVAPGVAVPCILPNGQVQLMDGTSFACPHVAGTGSLLTAGEKKFFGKRVSVNDEALLKLQTYVVDLGQPGYDFVSGRGFIDYKRLFYEYLNDSLLGGEESPAIASQSFAAQLTGLTDGARLVGTLNPERVSDQ